MGEDLTVAAANKVAVSIRAGAAEIPVLRDRVVFPSSEIPAAPVDRVVMVVRVAAIADPTRVMHPVKQKK